MHGQYLFDDAQLIETNPALAAVGNFPETLAFSLKPTKPVSNWLLAGAYLAGGGRVEAQRILSIGVHSFAASLIFWWLAPLVSWQMAGLAALWFGWLPLHAEALSVAWFRMDVAGTAFALLAVCLASRGRWLWSFVFVGLSALSKEVFVILAPAAVFAATGRKSALSWALPWGVLVGLLLILAPSTEYTYEGVLGFGVLGLKQIALAPAATGEWAMKTLTGLGLTTTSLADRSASGEPLVPWMVLGVAVWAALGAAAFRRGREAPWAAATLAGLLLYAAIPNLNLGAERYGYFPAACFAIALAFAFATLPPRARALAGLYCLVLLVPLAKRVGELDTRFSHYAHEARRHPMVPESWSNAAVAALELPGVQFLPLAEGFLKEAKALGPDRPRVWLAEFAYLYRVGDTERYSELWERRGPAFASNPVLSGGLEFQLGLLQAASGRCTDARKSFQSAEQRNRRLTAHPRPMCG